MYVLPFGQMSYWGAQVITNLLSAIPWIGKDIVEFVWGSFLVDIFAFFLVLAIFVFFFPNVLGHPLNYTPANPMVTPLSIQPEWYLLFAYAILRSIPNKLLGVIAMLASILILLLMPILDTSR